MIPIPSAFMEKCTQSCKVPVSELLEHNLQDKVALLQAAGPRRVRIKKQAAGKMQKGSDLLYPQNGGGKSVAGTVGGGGVAGECCQTCQWWVPADILPTGNQ